ncbi:MAG: HAMP domain-containing histidine kinase [Lactobacillales bacterium]|jgi:signal transduction histidine kinase|nr:HAMP domain-containing histidine kinase [Lactobacillales bacterium]
MKFFYQQLISFLVVIGIVITLFYLSVMNFSRNTLEQENYDELDYYAERILSGFEMSMELSGNSANIRDQFRKALDDARNYYEKDNLEIAFVTAKDSVPYSTDDEMDFKLEKVQWKELKQNKNIKYHIGDYDCVAIPFRYDQPGSGKGYELDGALVLSRSVEHLASRLAPIRTNLIRGAILALLISILVCFLFARAQGHKIEKVKAATHRVAYGEYVKIKESKLNDEFDELARDFNAMVTNLEIANDEILEQEERRKQFMANASHEMRTPLTTINGMLEGIKEGVVDEETMPMAVDLMAKETTRLIRLVKENLEYENIRANKIHLHLTEFDATEILEDIAAHYQKAAKEQNDKILVGNSGEININADYDRFAQIVVNLVTNALQFTSDGEIVLTAENQEEHTVVSVRDTGIGMDEVTTKKIFDRYYQADDSRTAKKGSSGLGLAIVEELIHLHDGKIEVESKLGEGTTFKVFFPHERT